MKCYVEALPSAARTAAIQSADIPTLGARGVLVLIDITAIAATPSVTFTIQGKIAGSYYTILASAAKTGTGQTIMRVYPGLTASANLIANDFLPDNIRIDVAVGDTDSMTYSVSCSLID